MKYQIKEIKEFILRCYASAGQNSKRNKMGRTV
jgi:hypothetical protein